MYFTPFLRIGTVGLDTNVFYTATARRTDLSGSGGPGLLMALPFSDRVMFRSEGYLNYLYFLRTADQRNLMGSGNGILEVQGERTYLSVGAQSAKTFNRPSIEIDSRTKQTTSSAQATLRRRLFPRTKLVLTGALARIRTDAGQTFLGTDLKQTLDQDTVGGTVGLEYTLTLKTALAVTGGRDTSRSPNDPIRDASSDRVSVGLQADPSALISGHALVGVHYFHPLDTPLPPERAFWADVDTSWHATATTVLGAVYKRDLTYTSFVTVSGAPTATTETLVGRIRQEFHHRIDFGVEGQRVRMRTDQAVRLVLGSGNIVEQIRDDVSYEIVGELGYKIADRLWAGGRAGYARRQSTISDFGIEGLLVGAKITYTP
jgi:hypothetical protein